MYEFAMHRGDASRRGWYGASYGDRPEWSVPWVSKSTPDQAPAPAQPARSGFWGTLLDIGKVLVEVGMSALSMNNPLAPSPVVAGSNVYGWNNRNVLCCWDAFTGGIKWQTGQEVRGPQVMPTPALAEGVVVVAEADQLCGFDATTGEKRWSRTMAGWCSTALLQGGVAYVIDDTGVLDASQIWSGRRMWSARLTDEGGGRTSISAAPSSDGRTLFASGSFGLYAIDPVRRQLLWHRNEDELSFTAPALFGGYVYITATGGVIDMTRWKTRDYEAGFLTAVRADSGRELWSRELAGESTISSATVSSGLAIVGDASGVVHAFDSANGQPHWTYTTGGPVWSSPSVSGNTVFFGSKDGHLYALDIGTGRLRWNYQAAAPILAAPAVGQGFVFVYDVEGSLYAVDAATGRGPVIEAGG